MPPKKPRRRARRAPFQIAVEGELLRLNRSTGQGYFLLHCSELGAKRRHYQGRLLEPDGTVIQATVERAARYRTGTSLASSGPLTVDGLVERFLSDLATHATKIEQTHFRCALEALRRLYGPTPAQDVGPLKLRATRDAMINSGRLSRWTVNAYIQRLVRVFRWGASYELVLASVADALRTVEPIRAGKCPGLRESKKVGPVPAEQVEAVLPLLSPQVAAIVNLMRWTGARCSEVCKLTPAMVDTSIDTWVARLADHKSARHGKSRLIFFGPHAREELGPWLLRPDDRACFSPREAEAVRRGSSGARAVEGERARHEDAPSQRLPGEMYSTGGVRRAIHRACDSAGVERWNPHQLRHTFATYVREHFDLETARILLGHASAAVAEVYAEVDRSRAFEAAERIG
ncbi:MAG: site-specific integrase [Planctomycetota bacterium]